MIKKLYFIALAIFYSGSSYGTPIYYTFTGLVTSVEDNAGIVTDTYNLTNSSDFVGSTVEYVYLVDKAADATRTTISGSTFTRPDTIDKDWFFTDFISGSLIDEKDGGFNNASFDIAESNQGFANPITSQLFGESEDETTWVTGSGNIFNVWIIGTEITGRELAFDNLGNVSTVISSLTITSISPVPIPAAVWLFGTALIGLVGFSKRRKVA